MAEILRCLRPGCGKEFPAGSTANSCAYHPGKISIRDGLKSWDCCSDLPGHKPTMDFDEFVKIPGCTTGQHSAERPKTQATTSGSVTMTKTDDGKEVYSSTASASTSSIPPPVKSAITSNPIRPPSAPATPPPPKPVEEEDDLDAQVPEGTKCKRCKEEFISQEESRTGSGPNATCTYHPLGPLFHEGSKGWMCCKKKVLEFDELFKIPGCKTGKHLFVPKKVEGQAVQEEQVKPRIDHYQTPSQVIISVFTKQVDKERSSVRFEEEFVHLDLFLPASKRCVHTINLWGPINPEASTFRYTPVKVELVLSKQDTRSWSLLERTAQALPEGFGYTFSAGGRTGTIGGKDLVLDLNNQAK
ncbi:hypothetical protein FRC03_010920 [Tulasnella sp. 419]|nr:hypothetical protein FRC03_010920 [Tulasnella sp. 419]